MESMFSDCVNLENLEIGANFNITNVKNKKKMLYNCINLSKDTINNILNKINKPQINY